MNTPTLIYINWIYMFPLLKLFFKSVIKLPIVILFLQYIINIKPKSYLPSVQSGQRHRSKHPSPKYLQSSISHHKIFSLDRKWDREYKHLTIGEQHTECQQIPYIAPEAPTVVIRFKYSAIGITAIPVFTLSYCDNSVTYCIYCTSSCTSPAPIPHTI